MTDGEALQGWFGWAARRPRLILTLFCLILWAPGVFSLPPLDRDESRFAQASKQMLETGDLIDIRFGHVPRYKKPVGIYWMQSAATAVAGFGERAQIWTYRLPSLLGALAAVWLTFWCAGAFLRREVALLAGALLGSTLLLTGEATIATTDAVLTACILGAQAVLFRVWLAANGTIAAPPRWVVLAGWVAFGLAVLVKGPVILAVTGLTAVGLCLWTRQWRWLGGTRPLIGIAIVLVMVAPWVIAIGMKSHWQFFQQSLGNDFATKLAGGQESHGFPPGYFLLALTPSFWPAVLFLLPGLVAAVRQHRDPAIRFLLVWLATWVVFELVPTKLPHYVLPLYPVLAILSALWAAWPQAAASWWDRITFGLAPVQFALGAILFAAAPVLLPAKYGDGLAWWALVPSILVAAVAIAALVFYFRRQMLASAVAVLAAPLIAYPLLTAGVGPSLSQLWVSPRLASQLKTLARPGDPPPALAGYIEPSMLFLTGTETRLTDGGASAADAKAGEGGLAVVESREQEAFGARLVQRELEAVEVGAVDGLNYSNGRQVHLRIWRVAPQTWSPPPPAE
jgi:4-amino-4-deoxy-L-arabinose transferase and related glycosyltransferases of PMT family